jgi:nucleotide-binding universal stress UspA family protein
MSVIVVGVDHSREAKAALRFAFEEAQLRRATLRVVHAWLFGYISATGFESSFPVLGGEVSEIRNAAEAAVETTLQEVVPDAGDVEIERRVVGGTPAAVLVEESRDAELLVVGSRGLGGFSGLLLGSVSQQCAHHAACPVVIVRSPREKPG